MAEPSPFFAQHHALEPPAINEREFRPFYRVQTRLDGLLADGAIPFQTWHAATRFRRAAEIVLAQQWPAKSLDRSSGAQASGAMIARRIDALDRLRTLRRELGSFAVGLLELHVVSDLSWAELGRHLNVHPKTARSWTIVALKALAMVPIGDDRELAAARADPRQLKMF